MSNKKKTIYLPTNKNEEAGITFANGVILLLHKNYNKRTSRAILKAIMKRLTFGLEEFK
jgi:hypothetical protein